MRVVAEDAVSTKVEKSEKGVGMDCDKGKIRVLGKVVQKNIGGHEFGGFDRGHVINGVLMHIISSFLHIIFLKA